MKKIILKSALLAVVSVGLMAGNAMALAAEWGVINPTDITGPVSYTPSVDFGYYIWTDDVERTSWHIRWMDGVEAEPTHFQGTISLENNTGSFSTYQFNNHDTFSSISTGASWMNVINEGSDGIDFTISQIAAPSYVGFNLNYQMTDMDSNFIFLGTSQETVYSLGEDQDFAIAAPIAAPIPEPTTMLLFGTGLVTLASFNRRKKSQKA